MGHSFPKAMMTEPRPGHEAEAQRMFVWGLRGGWAKGWPVSSSWERDSIVFLRT